MNLIDCPLRTPALLTDTAAAPQFQLRLQELGVRTGARLTVVNRAAFGGVVLNIAGTRVAVDHKSAKAMKVQTLP